MTKFSEQEVRLVKGLFAHTELNDQQVLSIFSHLHRDINSREVGYVRKGTKPSYATAETATKEEISDLLYRYHKVTTIVDDLGIGFVSSRDKQIYKAIDFMKTAISVFNNNTLGTRSETFIVLDYCVDLPPACEA